MARPQTRAGRTGARQPPEYVAVGRVLRPHGVRGALLLDAAPDLVGLLTPSTHVYLGAARHKRVVHSVRPHGRSYLLHIEGCDDRPSAEAWRGAEVTVRPGSIGPLPDGVYYHWEMIGLRVEAEDGERLGTLGQILSTGANDVYVVRTPDGSELLLPAIAEVIRKVDLESGRMIVHLLPGLRQEPPGA